MPPSGEEERIEQLRREMYSRKFGDEIGPRERRQLEEERSDVREDWPHEHPEEAGYVAPEMRVLEWIGKPVVVLLNQLGRPRPAAEEQADVQRWRAHLGGVRCVRVIHGKGLGSKNREPVLKAKGKYWLTRREEVLAYCQARPVDGGSGALLVLLAG